MALTARLGLSIPATIHSGMQHAARERTIREGRAVTIGDLYAGAIVQLAQRLADGEDIVFPAHPRGAVKKVSLRCEPAVAGEIARYAAKASRSCFVSTAARNFLDGDVHERSKS